MTIWHFPNLTVQPGSYSGNQIWHFKSLKTFCNLSVTNAKNDCHSQNNMQPFFLSISKLLTIFVFAMPNSSPGNYGQYIKFLKLCYLLSAFRPLLKRCLRWQIWMSVTHKILYNLIVLCFLKLTLFFIKTNFRSWAKPMHTFLWICLHLNTEDMAKNINSEFSAQKNICPFSRCFGKLEVFWRTGSSSGLTTSGRTRWCTVLCLVCSCSLCHV